VRFLAKVRARRGAAWLDKVWPGWVEKVNRPVDMENPWLCVGGQVFGTYLKMERSIGQTQAMRLGFYSQPSLGVSFTALDAAWAPLIEKRRELVDA
jgi:hypothetical protein